MTASPLSARALALEESRGGASGAGGGIARSFSMRSATQLRMSRTMTGGSAHVPSGCDASHACSGAKKGRRR